MVRGLLILALTMAVSLAVAEEKHTFAATDEQIAVAHNAIADSLKDPESLRLKDVVVRSLGDSNNRFICGQYNAKNSYGGYVGFRRFVVDAGGAFHSQGDTMGDVLISAFCD